MLTGLPSPVTSHVLTPLDAVVSGRGQAPVVQRLLAVPLHVGGRDAVVALSPWLLRPWCHDVVRIVAELVTLRGPAGVAQLPGQLLNKCRIYLF